jgi:AcrR family transcriptional regulator
MVSVVGLVYHDGMDVPRQEGSRETNVDSGRVNQKRRTRAALVEAARALLDEGISPTVSQAAERAMVSRTTAYRYFPTQDSLLLELAVNLDVDEIEALVQRPLADSESPVERTVAVMRALNRHVLDEEVQYRTSLRLYLDLWLAAVADGDETPVVREGRRRRWFTTTLSSGMDGVPAKDQDRLIAALGLLAGAEAVTVLRDIAQLDSEEALDVAEWAARTLIEATITAEGDSARKHRGR